MMKLLKNKWTLMWVSLVFCLSTFSGCTTVVIGSTSPEDLPSAPSYQERKTYMLWGLVGDDVDPKVVCQDGAVKQMQNEASLMDGVMSTASFGLYSPRTVKVWCDSFMGKSEPVRRKRP